MSTPPRFSYAHAVHHVTLRCNNREFLFDTDSFELFVATLQEARGRFPLSLYNYCLMTNHVHLLQHLRAVPRRGGPAGALLAGRRPFPRFSAVREQNGAALRPGRARGRYVPASLYEHERSVVLAGEGGFIVLTVVGGKVVGWFFKGVTGDPTFWKLPWKEKGRAMVGAQTLPKKVYEDWLLGKVGKPPLGNPPEMVRWHVKAGEALLERYGGWRAVPKSGKFLLPKALGGTVGTGPDAPSRAFIAATALAGGGTTYYILTQD